MQPIDKGEREVKWRETFKRFSAWNTKGQREVQRKEAEVMAAWLLSLKLRRYDILELGCGNGYFGKVLIERLQSADVEFSYHFTDFLPECIEQAKVTTRELQETENLLFSELDVFEIDTILPEKSQQIIVSTGYVSAATYREAMPKVARVLKPGGVLVCDFVNHFSPLVFLPRTWPSLKKLAKIMHATLTKKEPIERYHFGLIGIRPYFNQHGLELIKSRTIRLRRNPLICMFRKVE